MSAEITDALPQPGHVAVRDLVTAAAANADTRSSLRSSQRPPLDCFHRPALVRYAYSGRRMIVFIGRHSFVAALLTACSTAAGTARPSSTAPGASSRRAGS